MVDAGYLQNAIFSKENQIFNPLVLRGIGPWWDMSDSDTVHETTGGVELVDDKSALGIDLTQTNSSFRPGYSAGGIYTGVNSLDLNGSTDYMAANALGATGITAKPYTFFAVFKADSGGGTYGNCLASFNTSGNNGDSIFALTTAVECYYWNSAGSSRTGTTSVTGNKIGQSVIIVNRSGLYNARAGFTINTTTNKTETSNVITNWVGYSRNQFSVGMEFDGASPSDFFDGSAGELGFVNRHISDYEAVLLASYLAKKWGLSL